MSQQFTFKSVDAARRSVQTEVNTLRAIEKRIATGHKILGYTQAVLFGYRIDQRSKFPKIILTPTGDTVRISDPFKVALGALQVSLLTTQATLGLFSVGVGFLLDAKQSRVNELTAIEIEILAKEAEAIGEESLTSIEMPPMWLKDP